MSDQADPLDEVLSQRAVVPLFQPQRVAVVARRIVPLARQLLAKAMAVEPAPAVLVSTDLGVPQPGRADTRPLDEDDPGRLDPVVVVLTPFMAGAVLARPTPDGTGDLDAVLTFDRTCVETAARCLVVRL